MAKAKFSPLLHLTYVLQHLSDESLLKNGGVGLSQTRIMSVLNDIGTVSQNEIAMHLRQTEANVSRQLQVMKEHGLVSITKNKKDARQRDIKLTAKGSRKYLSAVKVLDKQETNLLKSLSKADQKVFNQGVKQLQNLL